MSSAAKAGPNELISLADKYGEAQRLLAIAATTLVRKRRVARQGDPDVASYREVLRVAASDLRHAEAMMVEMDVDYQTNALTAKRRCDSAHLDLQTLMSKLAML